MQQVEQTSSVDRTDLLTMMPTEMKMINATWGSRRSVVHPFCSAAGLNPFCPISSVPNESATCQCSSLNCISKCRGTLIRPVGFVRHTIACGTAKGIAPSTFQPEPWCSTQLRVNVPKLDLFDCLLSPPGKRSCNNTSIVEGYEMISDFKLNPTGSK